MTTVETADVADAMSRCPNCAAELAHEFCPQCGQRRIQQQELSVRHFMHEVADEVTNFRTQFKTLHTLRAMLTPGLLTAEYLAGRRQRHLSPFKTYLVCAAIYFLSAPLIFALHYISFMYLATVAAGLSRRTGLPIEIAAMGAYAVILPYLILSLKRVYAESTMATLLKGAALILLTIVLNDLTDFAAIRLTLALV